MSVSRILIMSMSMFCAGLLKSFARQLRRDIPKGDRPTRKLAMLSITTSFSILPTFLRITS